MENKCFLWNLFFIAPLFCISLFEAKVLNENEGDFENPENWPKYNNFGQISAVGVDSTGHIFVFHRGDRQWNSLTFKANIFVDKSKGPIPNDTIVVLNSVTGSLIKKTGANFFYMPHGLTIDDEHNVWVTDVAMHQVFKFPPINLSQEKVWEPELSLGVLLEPGNDDRHFCKPTSVAVDKFTKEFYVADGYCNGRIIKYDKSGKKLLQWGTMFNGFVREMSGYMLSVPHSLALSQERNILYVADREHFRVLSYDTGSGKFKGSFAEEKKERIFSVAYSSAEGGFLLALSNNGSSGSAVSVYDPETKKYLFDLFLRSKLTNPHDLAISPDGKYCYVVELNPYKIWKIDIDLLKISKMLNKNSQSDEGVKEPIPAESKISKSDNYDVSSSFLAVALVISIVVISFLFFMFHFYKKKAGFRKYEARRLILDDDESGIQLT